ncbi:HAD-IA family hydrolase [Vibrio sp. 10N.261.51.F12]|uniref:HAD-IA family hydrolase n=1 Tax=Vibrio sp. 10N.261.51.F12 TaxID=3229679 RepID=UPI00355451C6
MTELNFAGCLFDLDGTLVSSIESVNRAWGQVASKYQLDVEYVLSVIHGRTADGCVRDLLRNQSLSTIEKEIEWLKDQESNDTNGVVAIEGALEFLATLDQNQIPWGIVTSCNIDVAQARMKAGGIPIPNVFVTFEDVTCGKPAPEPYLLGAKKLGVKPDKCIVFEDAIAGVASAKSAGASVFGILSHATLSALSVDFGADNYRHLSVDRVSKQSWKLTYDSNAND